MTPIEKNIIVVDEQGREYEATYPKRAKGLVKNGRARFVAENKICLACPPKDFETEDIKMSDNISTPENTNYTIDYILSKLAELQEQLASSLDACAVANSAADTISGLSETENDTDYNELASTLCRPFSEREMTLRSMIRLYEKMYDDLVPKRSKETGKVIEIIEYAKTLRCEAFDQDVWDTVITALQDKLDY